MPQINSLPGPVPLPQPRPATAPSGGAATVPAPSPAQPAVKDTAMPVPPKGSAVPAVTLFSEPASNWKPLRDRVASELPRVDKLPGFKADINVARLKGMLAALDGPADKRIGALAAELKKAGYGQHNGQPPSEAGVMTGLKNYLDAINRDYHLKPRK